jgi:hypothetical protein
VVVLEKEAFRELEAAAHPDLLEDAPEVVLDGVFGIRE